MSKKLKIVGGASLVIIALFAIWLFSGNNARNLWYSIREKFSDEVTVGYNAKSLIAVDLADGEIFVEKKPNNKMAPASLAKLFVIDFANSIVDRGEIVTPKQEVLNLAKAGSSLAKLDSQKKYSVENLYAAMLVPSGNDAAYVLADFVGEKLAPDAKTNSEKQEKFLEKLNEYLRQKNYKNTKIHDPSGHDFQGETTTRDIQKVTENLLKNSWFRDIISAPEYVAKLPDGATQTWKNTNTYLDPTEDNYYKPGVKGVKTGSLGEDFNLVVLYEKNGKEFLIISLGSQSNTSRYDDVFYVLNSIDSSHYLFNK